MIFTVPKAVGTYTLGFGTNTVTFNEIKEANSVNAAIGTFGAIEITAITSTTISGNIQADAQDNGANTLNGTFTAQLCN